MHSKRSADFHWFHWFIVVRKRTLFQWNENKSKLDRVRVLLPTVVIGANEKECMGKGAVAASQYREMKFSAWPNCQTTLFEPSEETLTSITSIWPTDHFCCVPWQLFYRCCCLWFSVYDFILILSLKCCSVSCVVHPRCHLMCVCVFYAAIMFRIYFLLGWPEHINYWPSHPIMFSIVHSVSSWVQTNVVLRKRINGHTAAIRPAKINCSVTKK